MGLKEYLKLTIEQIQEKNDGELKGIAEDMNYYLHKADISEMIDGKYEILSQKLEMVNGEIERRNIED